MSLVNGNTKPAQAARNAQNAVLGQAAEWLQHDDRHGTVDGLLLDPAQLAVATSTNLR